MNRMIFDNAELFFQDFPIGTLSDEIEFHGNFTHAIVENFSDKYYAQVHSPDLVLKFALKEKSPQFLELLQKTSPVKPTLKQLKSEFGTIKIKTADGRIMKISEAFWIRFPIAEFQIRRNPENTIHSLYFLW